MTNPNSFFEVYAIRLSGADRRYLQLRLSRRSSGDLAEALDFLSGTRDMDRRLASARSCWELYDLLDLLQAHLERASQRPMTRPAPRLALAQ